LGLRPAWWHPRALWARGPVAIEERYLDAFSCDVVADVRGDIEPEPPKYGSIAFEQLRGDSGRRGIEAGLSASSTHGGSATYAAAH
jgi:hypothetical protein